MSNFLSLRQAFLEDPNLMWLSKLCQNKSIGPHKIFRIGDSPRRRIIAGIKRGPTHGTGLNRGCGSNGRVRLEGNDPAPENVCPSDQSEYEWEWLSTAGVRKGLACPRSWSNDQAILQMTGTGRNPDQSTGPKTCDQVRSLFRPGVG